MYDIGIKMKSATIPQYKVVREASLKYQTMPNAITGPDNAAAIVKAIIGDSDREHAVVLYLDTKHKVIGYEVVSIGTANQCSFSAKETFRGALIHGAVSIILGHNHPSGDPTPSNDDLNVTKALLEASKIIGISILDHVVVGDTHRSIREMCPHYNWAN
jgi:DNA repair protein RadC